ncbi:leucine-rich repeat flightless-interacting protein 2 [Eleginops maclovinus]|uniref:leucine-rich repeat flightless-interacting protein 2 n=1 Tax=Eleginops maclovinus TaxID=56733 RepID=UPI003080363C
MHSVTLDSNGSPRKRTISRGLSEDESLRSIIKETESSSRRLTRSDSRAGTLKRRTDSQHSDQDIYMGLPEMLELQASYDEVVQEMRGMEVERETLLFQVDVLQDTLEGVEELLAEAHREAGEASAELGREREAKRKLESMVSSLMQEVERLKEERNNHPSAPENTHEGVDDVDQKIRPREEVKDDSKELMKDSSLCEPHSHESRGNVSDEVVESDGEEEESVLMKLRMIVNKPLGHMPSLAVDNPFSIDGVLQRPYENGAEEGRDSDSISAYEDASAETPEQDRKCLGEEGVFDLPHDSEESSSNNALVNNGEPSDPKNPEACVVS